MSPRGQGNIDEVSRMLGSLESQAEAASGERRELAATVEKVAGTVDELKEQLGDVVSEIRRALLAVPVLEQRVAKMEPIVEEFKTMKQRVIGMAILWTVLGTIGAFIVANFKALTAWLKGAS